MQRSLTVELCHVTVAVLDGQVAELQRLEDFIERHETSGRLIVSGVGAGQDLPHGHLSRQSRVPQLPVVQDRADKPCTYCNKCLVNVVENPLGCYEESR